MNQLLTTYEELHELRAQFPNRKFYVKDHRGELTPIRASIKKKSDTYTVEFENGVVMKVGDGHAFMTEHGIALTAENLAPGDFVKTLTDDLKVIARYNFEEDQDVYDITVDSPHWYTNDESHGIIHHNTSFSLLMAAAYLDQHKDACLLFYDSEFGSPQTYFQSFGIDTSRVLHVPVKDVEELKLDLINQLNQLEKKKDRVIIIVDSVGNLASKKELEDALNDKSVGDMSRAKSLKALWRMATPYLTIKDIPCLVINHTYSEMGLYPKEIVSGGKGGTYSSNAIWIIGRQQDKVGTEIQGYHFIINIEKSRFVKEKSKIPVSVSWDNGIYKYTGLLDQALEAGVIVKVGHFVQLTDLATGELSDKKVRPKNIPDEYYDMLVKYQPFYDFIKNKYTIAMRAMLDGDSVEHDETEDDEE